MAEKGLPSTATVNPYRTSELVLLFNIPHCSLGFAFQNRFPKSEIKHLVWTYLI